MISLDFFENLNTATAIQKNTYRHLIFFELEETEILKNKIWFKIFNTGVEIIRN